MIQFEKPEWLYLLTLLPLLGGILYWLLWNRKRTLQKHFAATVIDYLDLNMHWRASLLRQLFLLLSIGAIILSLANPQTAGKEKEVELFGSDIAIVLDISASMLAQDVQPNRLSFTKRFIEDLITSIKGERVALVFFAGNAFVQMPLSADYAAALMLLRNAHPTLVSDQGTAIGDALELAGTLFDPAAKSGRMILLFTDGEDHSSETRNQIQKISDAGIRLMGFGIGTQSGALVPPEFTDGRSVLTRFEEANLRSISQLAGGSYVHLQPGTESVARAQALDEIQNLEKAKVAMKLMFEKESQYAYPLLLAFLFFVLYMLWPYPYQNKKGNSLKA